MLTWLRSRVEDLIRPGQNRTISLVANWLAGQLWNIENKFIALARQGYGTNEVVYACLRLLSQSVPEPPLIAYIAGEADEEKKPVPRSHPLCQLIRHPNELMTEYEFWELTTLYMAIVGKAHWWEERNNAGQVIALWPIRPDRIGPIYSDSDKPGERALWGYSYQLPGSGEFVPIPRRDVLAFNFPDPAGESGGIVEGWGPVQSLARAIATDNEATKFVGALLANYAIPSVILKLKGRIQDEKQAQLIKAKYRYEFGGTNRGEPMVVDSEADVTQMGFNLEQLEFPELREIAETRICSSIGVPAILVGVRAGLMRATYANFAEARLYFAETTLANYWRRFADQYTSDVASEFGENIVCEFDLSKVRALVARQMERVAPIKEAFAAGAATLNQYVTALGLPPLEPEFGDVFYLPAGVQVLPANSQVKALLDQWKQEGEEMGQNSPVKHAGAHAGHGGAHAGAGSGDKSKTGKEAEEAIRNAKVEHGLAYDTSGAVLFETEPAAENVVRFNAEQRKLMKGATVVHNHPSSGSFSGPDLILAEQNGVGTLRVVSPQYDYSLSVAQPKDWKRVSASYTTTNAKMMTQALADVRAGKRMREDVQANLAHEVMTAVARKTGASYTRTAVKQ